MHEAPRLHHQADAPPKVRFATDSWVEEAGFEPLVPRRTDSNSEQAQYGAAIEAAITQRGQRFPRLLEWESRRLIRL